MGEEGVKKINENNKMKKQNDDIHVHPFIRYMKKIFYKHKNSPPIKPNQKNYKISRNINLRSDSTAKTLSLQHSVIVNNTQKIFND